MNAVRIRILLALDNEEKAEVPRGWTQAEFNDEFQGLVVYGFIEPSTIAEPGFEVTTKAKVYIAALTALPDPVHTWTMP